MRAWKKSGLSDKTILLLGSICSEDERLASDLKYGCPPRDRSWLNKYYKDEWTILEENGLTALGDDGVYHATQMGIDFNKVIKREAMAFCDKEFARIRREELKNKAPESALFVPPEPSAASASKRGLFERIIKASS